MLHLSRRILIVLAWTTPALITLGAVTARAQTTWYVDQMSTDPTHNGSSWCDAFDELPDALVAAASGDTILVADGTYTPSPRDDPPDPCSYTSTSPGRADTFQLKSGVTIKGGYAGCGAPDPDDRSIGCVGVTNPGELCSDDNDCPGGTCKYPTILSGDLCDDDDPNPTSNCCSAHLGSTCDPDACKTAVCAVRDLCCGGACKWDDVCAAIASVLCPTVCGNTSENSYHVVSADSTITSSAVLDGFTVRGGFADGSVCEGTSQVCNTDADCVTDPPSNPLIACLDASGGGMQNDVASPTVTNCLFRDNRASMCGGGMYNTNASSPAVSSCTFLDNTTREEGAGMYNDDGSNPTVTACSFTGNVAELGGGVYNQESDPTFTGCTFAGNVADAGGGMYNTEGSAPEINKGTAQGSSCLFENNRGGTICPPVGSAMYNSGSGTNTKVQDCTFRQNEVFIVYANDFASPEFRRCRFEDNILGPVLYEVTSSSQYVDCQFVNNHSIALLSGGSNPTFIGCQFTGNTHGLDVKTGGGSATWNNCVFEGNVANPVIAIGDTFATGTATFTNCTIVDNQGVGIKAKGGNDLTVTNSIIWGNTSAIQHEPSDTVVVNYSDIQGGWSGTGNIDVDPAFASGECGSYHITEASPCSDAGDPTTGCTANEVDACDGHLRCTPSTGTQIDMGAYEVECVIDDDCVFDSSKGVCKTSTNRCVECVLRSHCPPPPPLCTKRCLANICDPLCQG